jgi:hypothetical protein
VSQSRGRPLRLNAYDVDRFRSRVLATSTCAIWLGAVGADGYGRFSLRQPGGGRERMVTPHQVAAVLAFGELEEGVTLLHDCDVRLVRREALVDRVEVRDLRRRPVVAGRLELRAA